MKLHSALFASTAVLLTLAANAATLTPADYCYPGLTAPSAVKDMRPMADGETFAAVSDDGKSIQVFSYKTGKEVSTLFSVQDVKGDLKIDSFDGYQISDNEKKILLWKMVDKIYRYSYTAEYYVYDILRGTLARVSEGGPQRGAVMSHDGRMVAYQRDNNLFISNIDYKSDKAITTDGKVNEVIYGTPDWSYEEEFDMANSICWSSDDCTLAFLRFDESKVPVYSFDNYLPYESANPLGELYPEPYSYKYPLAGFPCSQMQVLAYNVDNRTTKRMDLATDGEYVPHIQFDGEGTNLMVMLLNRAQNDLRLFRINPASTVAHEILREVSKGWHAPQTYGLVKYYDKSFVFASERSGYRHLYEYDYNGNLLRQLTSGNWNVTDYYGYDPKSGLHYVQTTQRGAINRNVASVDKKGNVSMLNDIDGTESASFSRGYNYFVRKYSNALTPPQYTVCNNKGKQLIELVMNREYAKKYSSAPKMEFLKVPNANGEEMDAYLIKPADFDPSKKYPLMVYQYNGPDSQLVLNAWKIDGLYYIASQGYVVATVDGRGTGNRSREWAYSVYKHLGEYETEDQLAGAKYLASLPYIDADRTSCFGWSYGGYMTLMELASPECRFKCGVAMAPVTDWRLYDAIYTERFMLTPQENESGYNRASALLKSENVNSRLLIMSGTNDDNVHFYNTLKYTSKMSAEGKTFDMMALTGLEHSLREGNSREMLYKKIVDFLDTQLK